MKTMREMIDNVKTFLDDCRDMMSYTPWYKWATIPFKAYSYREDYQESLASFLLEKEEDERQREREARLEAYHKKPKTKAKSKKVKKAKSSKKKK